MEYVYYAYTLITVVLLIYMLTKLKSPFLYLVVGALITGFVIISQMALDDTKGYPAHHDEPRTYRIESTTENKKSIARAMSKIRKGVPVKVVKKTKKQMEYNDSEYSFNEIIPRNLIPKPED